MAERCVIEWSYEPIEKAGLMAAFNVLSRPYGGRIRYSNLEKIFPDVQNFLIDCAARQGVSAKDPHIN